MNLKFIQGILALSLGGIAVALAAEPTTSLRNLFAVLLAAAGIKSYGQTMYDRLYVKENLL